MSLTKKLKHFGSAGLIGLAGVVGGGCETFEDTAALGALYGAAAMNEPNPARANAMAAAGQYLGQMADYQARQEIAERGRTQVNVNVGGGGEGIGGLTPAIELDEKGNRIPVQTKPEYYRAITEPEFFACTGYQQGLPGGGPNIVRKNIFYEGETIYVVANATADKLENYKVCLDTGERFNTIDKNISGKGPFSLGCSFDTSVPNIILTGTHWEIHWLINGKEAGITQFSIIRNRPNPDGQK